MRPFFIGSAVGAASAGAAWSNGGWSLACGLGIAFLPAAFIVAMITEFKGRELLRQADFTSGSERSMNLKRE